MPVEHHEVQLVSPTGGRSHGAFSFDEEEGDVCRLTFRYSGGEFTAEASDYFEAMCQIRLGLEGAGWRPVCYGGSRDVYPSGMCRDMGRGLKAYRLHPGRPARLADLVAIFDSGPEVEPASVEKQRQFFDRWLQSLGGGK